MKHILITVREGGAPVIEKYPDGFPVDGDARHHGSRPLKKRAADLTKEQFEAQFTEFEEPYFEYDVKFLPRRNDVVEHGSLEQAKAALIDAPILRASGEYGIVRRLTHEPGRWEIVPDATFDGDETS